jgi:hypothetical protein
MRRRRYSASSAGAEVFERSGLGMVIRRCVGDAEGSAAENSACFCVILLSASQFLSLTAFADAFADKQTDFAAQR